MEELEANYESIKSIAATICEKNNLTFIGFFQNSDRSYERVLTEGLKLPSTPNGTFHSNSFNEIIGGSDIQSLLSILLNPDKSTISSNKSSGNIESTYTLGSILPSENSLNASNGSTKSYKKITIDPHNKVSVKNYLYTCFEELQQIPCKLIAKAWIKIVEPKKQSKYPYKNGNSSKPYWWPSTAVHKEPDHLKKDERINLLINILRIFKHRETELLYAASLINSLRPRNKETNSGDLFGERKMDLLKDMFKTVSLQNNSSVKFIRVIKPGKKYSSQIYQKNKPIQSNGDSVFHNSTFVSPEPNQKVNSLKFPDLLITPPSNPNSHKTIPKKHCEDLTLPSMATHNSQPPLNSSLFEYFTNEFMQFVASKAEADKSGNSESSISNYLSSPFQPSYLNNNKSLYNNPNYQFYRQTNDNDAIIDPKFFSDPPDSVSNGFLHSTKNITPKNNIKSIPRNDYSISTSPLPPTGTFKNDMGRYDYNLKNNSNVLTALAPSKLNKLNSISNNINLNNVASKKNKFSKPDLNFSQHKQTSTFIPKSPKRQNFDNRSDETEYDNED